MFIEFGYLCLLVAFTINFYSIFANGIGIYRNNKNLLISAKNATFIIGICVGIAYIALTYAFIINDFSVIFVRDNSSQDLPLFYKITGVWGGMDGSLLLWETILAFYIVWIAFKNQKTNREILPHTLLVLNLISGFLLFLLIGWSNPLAQEFPAPLDGKGLNPLLQNPGMVIHPPTLYLGFIGYSIPFAFAIGSLLYGKFNNEWILYTRNWTLSAWFFNTIGMILGGNWAYVELGWGGYWAWDPVENSSFLPWLTASAFLHSAMVQERRNTLKIWNILLIIFTFSLTMLGTFITRSGLLNSVHSFAESNIGPAFLVFIAFTLIFSFLLLFWRMPQLESKSKTAGIICKENAFLINNVLFVGVCFSILYCTLFPLIAEAVVDRKISIQAPFFNQFTTPFGIAFLCLMGITPFIAWKKASLQTLRKNLLIPLIMTCFIFVFSYFYIGGVFSLQGILTFTYWNFVFLASAIYFAAHATILEMSKVYKVQKKQSKIKSSKQQTSLKLKVSNPRKWGGIMVHLGVIVMFAGFLGNFFKIEDQFSLYPGDSKPLGDYSIYFVKEDVFQQRNAKHFSAILSIFKEGKEIGTLKPAKAIYPTSEEPTTEVAIYKTLQEDVYVTLASLNEDGSATLRVFINPMVNLVWLSMVFFLIGILLSILHKPIHRKKANE